MPQFINVVCAFCQTPFQKLRGEFNRSERLGRKHYCKMECYGKDAGIMNIPKDKSHNPQNLIKAGWQKDDLSPFRRLYLSAKTHSKRRKGNAKICSISLLDLKTKWDQQDGICPITGWKLQLPSTTLEQLDKTPDRASLDRIDSKEGYVPGNIRFIALIAQFAKNGWADEDVIRFCHAVSARGIESLPQQPQETLDGIPQTW